MLGNTVVWLHLSINLRELKQYKSFRSYMEQFFENIKVNCSVLTHCI